MFTDEDVVKRILQFYMRTLTDSDSSERRLEDVQDSESESVSANIIYRASSALYETFDLSFLSETQQC